MNRKGDDFVPYSPLPSNPYPPSQNVVVLLPAHRPRRRDRRCVLYSTALFLFLLLATATFILYPSDPEIQVVRVHLNHIGVKTSPRPILDVSFSLTVKIRNRDFFSLNYDSLVVSVGYRGRELGIVRSEGGRLRARGSSYIDATLSVDGFEFIHDVFYLLEDLAKGVIPFDTRTQVKGELGLLFLDVPLKGIVSCEIFVNTNNQSVVRQNCYPEDIEKSVAKGRDCVFALGLAVRADEATLKSITNSLCSRLPKMVL